ncbi:MAG: universal stress protein [Proteobacteria bacterium]|nr:universal stress protein [Pseudomonadota bacterium]
MTAVGRILSPVDFSETSERALRYALELAGQLRAEIHLLHVVPPPLNLHASGEALPLAMSHVTVSGGVAPSDSQPSEVSARMRDASKNELAKLVERYADRDVVLRQHVTQGDPRTQILRMAQTLGADLIVMGTHGHTGLSHALLGSVAERVLRASDVPVLSVSLKAR